METISATESLRATIVWLENKRTLEGKLLKEKFDEVHESLRPINFVKDLFTEVTESPDIRTNFVSSIIGLATGHLTSKLLIGSSHNPVKKMLGVLLQFGVTNIVSKHSDRISSAGENLVKKILNFRKQHAETSNETV